MAITKNVMKLNEWDNIVWYEIGCSCTGDDCKAQIEFDINEEFNLIHITFYKKIMWSDYWGNNTFYKKIYNRIKASLRILFTGYIDMEGDFMIQDEDHMDSFIEALKEGRQKMVECKKRFEDNKNG